MTTQQWFWLAGLAGVVLLASQRVQAGNADDTPIDDAGNDMPSDSIQTLALAIAHAEGFFVAGSIPQRAQNPGDLVVPGWTGAKLGDQGISVFATEAEGWARLRRQLNLIGSWRSHVYEPTMTFNEIGAIWTATESQAWTTNVVAYLRSHGYPSVSADTSFEDFLSL